MAKSTQSLQFICRSCRQSVSRSSQQVRTFSNSASRSSIIPKFQPTSSAELDALLLDWRQRVFTPAALNTTHQALIYKKSRRSILENDPGVTVTMSDGEEIKLEPMEAFDKPNKMDSLAKIAEILSNTTDQGIWLQLPTFLEGMQLARQPVPVWFLEKLTRKANEQGKAGMIKQCAAMYKKTGVSLSMKPVTTELFLGCHMRFVEALNQKEDFEKEHKFAQDLVLMMESEDHRGTAVRETRNMADMRKDLTVVGVLLEFAAAKAIQEHSGKDVDGTVTNFSKKLIALAGQDVLKKDRKQTPSHTVEEWLPIANGIRLAMQVSGTASQQNRNAEAELKLSLKKLLGQLDPAIEKELAKLKAEAQGKPRRAQKMYEALKKV